MIRFIFVREASLQENPEEKIIMIYQPDRQVQIIEDLDRELIMPEFASMVKLTAGDVFNWLTIE